MPRLILLCTAALSLSAMVSCSLGIDRVFLASKGTDDARVILRGMQQTPLRNGDTPVDIEAR